MGQGYVGAFYTNFNITNPGVAITCVSQPAFLCARFLIVTSNVIDVLLFTR